jgi:23S rRNA (adenine2503-C2)-methyltransferase
MGCVFCKTAGAGFKRNLTSYEIVQQVLFFKYYLNESSKKITNIVFMGMGEPFLNYKNVIEAVKIINDKDRINIGSRKISISTCGIPGMIIKLAEEKLQVNLAVSLNAADDSLRGRLMPVNNKYPLNSLLTSIGKYIEKTNRRVMFEYVMLKGINDSTGDAEKLSRLLKRNNLRPGLYFINLIPFNGKGQLSAPDPGRIKRFKEILEKENIIVTRRYRFGSDISGACGQLVYSNL